MRLAGASDVSKAIDHGIDRSETYALHLSDHTTVPETILELYHDSFIGLAATREHVWCLA